MITQEMANHLASVDTLNCESAFKLVVECFQWIGKKNSHQFRHLDRHAKVLAAKRAVANAAWQQVLLQCSRRSGGNVVYLWGSTHCLQKQCQKNRSVWLTEAEGTQHPKSEVSGWRVLDQFCAVFWTRPVHLLWKSQFVVPMQKHKRLNSFNHIEGHSHFPKQGLDKPGKLSRKTHLYFWWCILGWQKVYDFKWGIYVRY